MKQKMRQALVYILVILVVVIWLFPIYWMVNTSFKSEAEIYRTEPTFLPESFTFEAYRYLFEQTGFLNAVKNSFIVAFVVALFSILICFPAAYALARFVFKGRKAISTGILMAYLVPASVLYIPLYILVSKLALSNTIYGLMLIYPVFTLPYVAWILVPYLRSIPKSIEEASLVDGCNRFQTMYRIVLPAALPGVMSTFIFAFTLCWGEYLYALVNILSTGSKTYPLIISGLIYGDLYPWNQIMAAGVCVCIPIIILYTLANKYIVGGVVSGSVKE